MYGALGMISKTNINNMYILKHFQHGFGNRIYQLLNIIYEAFNDKQQINIQELKSWYKKNGDSYQKTNNKAIDIFYSTILYIESVDCINNNSFSFALLLSALKRQPFINILKIIIKFFIKKISGVRV